MAPFTNCLELAPLSLSLSFWGFNPTNMTMATFRWATNNNQPQMLCGLIDNQSISPMSVLYMLPQPNKKHLGEFEISFNLSTSSTSVDIRTLWIISFYICAHVFCFTNFLSQLSFCEWINYRFFSLFCSLPLLASCRFFKCSTVSIIISSLYGMGWLD